MTRIVFALAAAALAVSTAAVAAPGSSRAAGPYNRCARYTNMTGDCGCETYAQCREALAGNGGQCAINTGWIGKHPDRAEPAPLF
jgi:hypothetical protein